MNVRHSKWFALAMTAVMLLSAAGCAKDSGSSQADGTTTANPDAQQVEYELTFMEVNSENSTSNSLEEYATAAPTEDEEISTVTGSDGEAYVIVTDDQGEPATDDQGEPATERYTDATEAVTTVTNERGTAFVVVTDDEGSTETDAQGEPVTEVYTTTKKSSGTTPAVTTVTNSQGTVFIVVTDESGSETQTEVYTTVAPSEYTASVAERRAVWLDMKKNADYVFNGEFLSVTFQVAENTPDGLYRIDISHTDFANYDAESLDVGAAGCYIAVNTELPNAETPSNGSVQITAQGVTAQPGDEVTVVFSIANNPGCVGFVFGYTYDQNALTLVDGSEKAVGEYADISQKTGRS